MSQANEFSDFRSSIRQSGKISAKSSLTISSDDYKRA